MQHFMQQCMQYCMQQCCIVFPPLLILYYSILKLLHVMLCTTFLGWTFGATLKLHAMCAMLHAILHRVSWPKGSPICTVHALYIFPKIMIVNNVSTNPIMCIVCSRNRKQLNIQLGLLLQVVKEHGLVCAWDLEQFGYEELKVSSKLELFKVCIFNATVLVILTGFCRLILNGPRDGNLPCGMS